MPARPDPTRRVDNRCYERLDPDDLENGPLGLLIGINAARLDYLRRVLKRERGGEPAGARLLDVGCGIGLVSEPLARLGYAVTGIDPSPHSLELARERAARAGLAIGYRVGRGEDLPYPDASFEVVTCCDVLEHVEDLPRVLSELARVLTPGGVFCFSTLNRTFLSWLLAIKGLQDWRLTRLLSQDLHAWPQFIRPDELERLLSTRGLTLRDLTGLKPSISPLAMFRALRACKRGEFTAGEFGRRLAMRPSDDVRVQYLGYALKSRVPRNPKH